MSGDSQEDTAEKITERYCLEIQESGIENVQILSPFRSEGAASSEQLNETIRELVNPFRSAEEEIKFGPRIFRVNDRIMQTKNTEKVSNGDLGFIRYIKDTDQGKKIGMDFGAGRTLEYGVDDLSNVDLAYATGSQRECLLAAFDSNKKIILVKKDETVVARACLRLTKGAFQKPPAIDFSFADLSQENTATGKSAAGEKAVLFLESVYTSRLNDIEKEEVMKLAVSLTTQKAAELGVVAVLARKYLGCYERDEYVLAPFYVYISKSKNGWQYLDSLGGAAYTSAKEEYVEHPFLVTQTAMHHTGANNRNEVDYE